MRMGQTTYRESGVVGKWFVARAGRISEAGERGG